MIMALRLFLPLFTIFIASLCWAGAIPSAINYQGYLSDMDGKPLPDGDYELTFRLYSCPVGCDALWTEAWTGDNLIPLANGRFHVRLGNVTPLGAPLLSFDERYYLEVEVGSYGTLEPRLAFTAVPYANRAANVDAMAFLSGDVVGTTDTQELSGKTIRSSDLTGGTIENTGIAGTEATFTRVSATNNLTVAGHILSRVMIGGAGATGNYSVKETDGIILVDASAEINPVAINLPPAAANAGRDVTVKLIAEYRHALLQPDRIPDVMIYPTGGETINGKSPLSLYLIGQSVRLVCDGSSWQAVDEVGNLFAAFTNPTGGDLIVGGSQCVGYDCVNGENFNSDTLRLKENNLRIYFDDTSSLPGFPSNDWRLTANDSANGGASFFSIDDVDHGISGLSIGAGGNVGVGTVLTPLGRLRLDVQKANFQSGTGTVSLSQVPGTGTVSVTLSDSPAGDISSTGTSVTGIFPSSYPPSASFTAQLVVGCLIKAAGETKTVTKILDNMQFEVDSAWASDLSSVPAYIQLATISGNGTQFLSELHNGEVVTVEGVTAIIHSISNDTLLRAYATKNMTSFTDAGFTYPGTFLNGTGTRFSAEITAGDTLLISDRYRRVTSVNSDTELEVDSPFQLLSYNDLSFDFLGAALVITGEGKAGIGTNNPDTAFEVECSPSAEVTAGQGTTQPGSTFFSLRNADGARFYIQVDDEGHLSASATAP